MTALAAAPGRLAPKGSSRQSEASSAGLAELHGRCNPIWHYGSTATKGYTGCNNAPAAAQHTVAVTADEVVTWGGNGEGQCGQGERAEPDFVKPRSLRALRGMAVTQVACGAAHTLVLTAASQVGVARAVAGSGLRTLGIARDLTQSGRMGLPIKRQRQQATAQVRAQTPQPLDSHNGVLIAGQLVSPCCTVAGV